ncbi:tRNA (adenosine(37)-N6)-dimethylallyltransferase MiaA [Cyanobacterium sp. IPPAS B-1200]|uniref:tRNA (adenosine(37)-N6)-dimethylallyltransferase MiaA n=1 Tax=Cyanobacterium sp. IPPAS B-1200 TaxID=1562720 RepID=UPI0008527449|nr:tRNA (adenosine(37)-N6)-dimethylallyltransferase MiaA [Cyanobacterium sp. IPPAS B-1200]OEJ79229.1 tRNA (adenosine(37)-N6)-dimethylallyltransferase MiaA [Cyanobacterium sp. IPPAS B-1200]
MKKYSLIVVCGATASGKSSLALKLAQKLNSIIISADSRQIYQEFDIGTAKPSIQEQKTVPHHLIDICHPTETLTLADYQEKAQALIQQNHHLPPLLVGGTGLYIKSITKGLKIPRVAPQPQLRQQLMTYDQKQRYAMLKQVDDEATKKIHPNDETRTIRALEVYYVIGQPISEQQGECPPSYPILQIGLHCDGEMSRTRISKRTSMMLEEGLVQEVETLMAKYGADLPLLNTLGYGEIKQYLLGDISLDEAQDLIVTHTCQFAKRQRTWFNAYPEINWFDADAPDLFRQVMNLFER